MKSAIFTFEEEVKPAKDDKDSETNKNKNAKAKKEVIKTKEKRDYLELIKNAAWDEKSNKDGAKAYYNDGLWYMLPKAQQPKHIMFSCRTTNADRESCDFRLTTLLDSDAI